MDAPYERAKEEILRESAEDHVGLWEVIGAIRRWLPDAPPEQVKDLVLRCVQELMEEGQVRAGQPTADGRGFEAWDLSPPEVVAAIEVEWNRLGRAPTIGEVVWLHRETHDPV